MRRIEVKGLVKRFSGVLAVDDVSFSVEDCEFVSLLGPSGCGKTTILRCIAGHERPDEGEITISDKIMFSSKKGIMVPPHKRELAMVFQSYALWPHMTVFKNIAYPFREKKYSQQQVTEKVKEILDLLNLQGLENRFPFELSGGQQQRVALGRALVYESQAILLDEPLSNLDAKLREQMRLELKSLKTKIGMTAVYVTHDRHEALTLSDKIFVINAGKIIGAGTPKELYSNPPNGFVAEFLGLSNCLSGSVLGSTDNTCKVMTEDSLQIECSNSKKLSVGEKVSLYAAPTDIDILERNELAKGNRGINVWEVQVLNYGFTGEFTDYEVQLGKSRFFIRKFGFFKELEEKVYMRINPESFRLIQQAPCARGRALDY